ncbi:MULTISPECIES: hypothetical protein [Streptomyces]|uniref:hypothetical protein n=1 Tax=Streptomyces TaxID=1883 RepID=UPI000699B26B|nr:hypothetical protein [Streptomyces sp. SID7805]MYU52059.1 hypothetical protein [Streptomyces sp. SID7805]
MTVVTLMTSAVDVMCAMGVVGVAVVTGMADVAHGGGRHGDRPGGRRNGATPCAGARPRNHRTGSPGCPGRTRPVTAVTAGRGLPSRPGSTDCRPIPLPRALTGTRAPAPTSSAIAEADRP